MLNGHLIELLKKFPLDVDVEIVFADTRQSGGMPADWFSGKVSTLAIQSAKLEEFNGKKVICLADASKRNF